MRTLGDPMGMYTELHFNALLREDVPDSVLAGLVWAGVEVDSSEYKGVVPGPERIPGDWYHTGGGFMQSDSYYFPADTTSTMRWDDISRQWYLCLRFNTKNYCHDIQQFLAWICEHCDCDAGYKNFVGFMRYEEDDLPTLILFKDGAVKYVNCNVAFGEDANLG